MHRLTTGRVFGTQATVGSTVLGTVPAGKVWELRYLQLQHKASTSGCDGAVDGVDAVTGVVVPLQRLQGGITSAVFPAIVGTKLNSGDSIRVRCAAVPPITAFISYIER